MSPWSLESKRKGSLHMCNMPKLSKTLNHSFELCILRKFPLLAFTYVHRMIFLDVVSKCDVNIVGVSENSDLISLLFSLIRRRWRRISRARLFKLLAFMQLNQSKFVFLNRVYLSLWSSSSLTRGKQKKYFKVCIPFLAVKFFTFPKNKS